MSDKLIQVEEFASMFANGTGIYPSDDPEEFARAYAKYLFENVVPLKYKDVKSWEERESAWNECIDQINEKLKEVL